MPGTASKQRFLWAICALLIFGACGKRVYYSEVHEVPEEGWQFSDTLSFDVEVTDSITPFDFYLTFNNTKDYQYSNCIFFLKGSGPNELKSLDTLECFVAYPDGRWTGKGFGAEVSNKFLFKQQMSFPQPGSYRFSFIHAMRDTVLENITNLGLIIEHSNS